MFFVLNIRAVSLDLDLICVKAEKVFVECNLL